MASNVLAKMAVLISAQTAEFNKAMAQSSGQLKQFQATANSVSKSLASVGVGFGLFQAVGVIQSAIGTIKDFEASMSEVKAITGATADEFDALRNSALDLGKSTKFTATEISGLQLELGRLGFTTKEILDATEAILSLATATGEDLAKSADVVGSTIRGFGLAATETQRVVDVMAESFNKSALGLDNFSEAMKYVAPVAAQAGITLEETTAMLGTLADNGIRGSQAGTSLRKIISDLGGESGTLAEKLQKLSDKGLTGADAMSEVGRTAYASLLVLANNTEKTDGLTKSLNKNADAAKKAADIMSDNLAGDLTKLSSAYDSLVLSGGGFTKALREITQAATNLVNVFSSTSESGFIKMLTTLIEYTPNLYNVARAVNAITDAFSLSKDEQIAYINRLGQLRDAAILRNDQKNVEMYTKSILDLTAKWGLLKSVPLEFSDAIKEQEKVLDDDTKSKEKNKKEVVYLADSLGGLRQQLSELNSVYDQTSQKDTDRLRMLRVQIDSLDDLISRMERIKGFNKSIVFSDVIDTQPLYDSAKGIEGIMTRVDVGIQKLKESTKTIAQDVGAQFVDMSSMIVGAISSVSEAFGAMLVNGSVHNFGQSILKAVATFARQLGEALIAIGIGIRAAQQSLANPFTAIAAGVALVALAGALNAAASKAQSNFNGGGGSSGSMSRPTPIQYSEIGQRIELEIIPGEMRLEGQTIVAAVTAQEKRNGRNRG